MDSALEQIADAAEQVAADQRDVARRARAMQRQRDRGWSWRRVFDAEPASGLVRLLRRSSDSLRTSTTAFTGAVVRALVEEGETRRAIAARLGISHQRVTRLVGDEPRSKTRSS